MAWQRLHTILNLVPMVVGWKQGIRNVWGKDMIRLGGAKDERNDEERMKHEECEESGKLHVIKHHAGRHLQSRRCCLELVPVVLLESWEGVIAGCYTATSPSV